MEIPEFEQIRLKMETMNKEAYADRGYQDIKVVAVEDEDKCESDTDVAALLEKGYKIIDINAFGSFMEGRAGSFVTLVLEQSSAEDKQPEQDVRNWATMTIGESDAKKDREKVTVGEYEYLIDRNKKTAWISKACGITEKVFTLPEKVVLDDEEYTCESVEIGAYWAEPVIEELIVPDYYNYIDEDCFKCCENLRKVSIGKGLDWYNKWNFGGCPLEKVTISEENPYLKVSPDGALVLSKDGKTVLALVDRNAENIDIPEGVEKIAEAGISCSSAVKTLTLPSTLKEIGPNGIFEMDSIKELIIPEGVEEIKLQGLSWNESLELIDIPSSCHKIGWETLTYDSSLKKIILRSKEVMVDEGEDCRFESFSKVPLKTCILAVPAELVEEYRKHPHWKKFKHIEKI